MKYNLEVFRKQFPLVKFFAYHLTYYWELHRAGKRLQLKSVFWALTTDAHLVEASVYWCMVFGSQGMNRTHWKNLALSKKAEQTLREDFTEAVVRHTGFTEAEWRKYWEEMLNFRNKYAVHKEDYKDPIPYFDKGLNVAYAYDEWVRKIFSGFWEEPPLKESVEDTKRTIRPLIEDLLSKNKLP